ncbi:MAG TPA: hypothetical protein VG253_15715, partial [Streptosporangiaceae bacterium]|nr:hypothetical protein [Streptosporangiaceae bacterium]
MTASATLSVVTPAQGTVVERLWQLYVHDLSEFRGSMPGSDGLYQRTRLHAHMNDPDRHGYLISAGPS